MTGSLLSLESKARTVNITPEILPTPDVIGEVVADRIVALIEAKGRTPFLLGCPSGRTAVPVYAALARRVAAGADLSTLIIVMMDDYVLENEDGTFQVVDPDASYSCLGFARRDILAPLTAAAARAGVPAPTEIWTADPENPSDYDARIESAGGIDLFILASGDSDGHVAFNQPGTDRSAGTHLVNLGEATRRDNMDTFPEFVELDMVPRKGITVGIDTIAGLSESVIMILTGDHKQTAFTRITTADAYDATWPATIVTECRNPLILADMAADVRV